MGPLDLTLAFVAGFGASFVFVATGGVGLVTVPTLVFLGMSPQTAIATDLFALLGGRAGGLLRLRREGLVDIPLALLLMTATGVGALGGALVLPRVPEELMQRALGAVLLAMLGVLLFRPDVGVRVSEERTMARTVVGTALFVVIGFWGALVGAGFLNLGALVLVFVFRRSFLESAGILTIVGLSVALVALVVFSSFGLIVWPVAFTMLVAKTLGAYLGAGYAVRLGDRWVRIVFAVVVTAAGLKLLV